MMVRAVTPAAATGKVFAFVMTGLNVGAALSPVLFGLILDVGDPRLVFWLPVVFFTLAILVILMVEQLGKSQAPAQPEQVAAE
jgi:MFS family permease